MMRIFTAISLSPEIIEEVTLIQNKLKDRIPGVKWVKKENMHITLRFIGEVEAQTAKLIAENLQRVNMTPFELANSGNPGAFPNFKRPRVLWLGLEPETTANMKKLFELIENALEKSGVEREKRPFKPHITLGRIPSHLRWKREYTDYILGLKVKKQSQKIVSFELIESRLFPSGAVYNALESYALTETGARDV